MRRISAVIFLILLASGLVAVLSRSPEAQTHTFPALDTTNVFTGVDTFNTLNSVLYVGGSTTWAGADIGAQINTVYAALPATGGTIVVLPKTGGGSYIYTTPIVFATANKPVLLVGTGVAGNNQNNGGVILEYTPTTATCGITEDYTNSTGSNTVAHGIRDLSLWNGHVFTVGGSGSSATGVCIGNTNGGAGQADYTNLNLQGWGIGYDGSTQTSGVGWGSIFHHLRASFNNTAVKGGPWENLSFDGGSQFLSNGTGVLSNNNTESAQFASSYDGNTTLAASWTAASSITTVSFVGAHFENPGCTNLGTPTANYVSGNANFQFFGGIALDDCLNTSPNLNWMFSFSGLSAEVYGLEVTSSGQTMTSAFLCNATARCFIQAMNGSPTVITTMVTGAGSITNLSSVLNTSNTNPLWQFESQFKVPLGIGDAAFTPSSSSGLHLRMNSATFDLMRFEDTGGTPKVFTMGPGTGGCPGGGFGIRNTSSALQMACFGYTAPNSVAFNQGVIDQTEVAAPAGGLAGSSRCYPDSTSHTLKCSYNNGSFFTQPQTIASGTTAMTTALIATVACGTTATTAATGVLTTDVIDTSFNTAVTAANNGLLIFKSWPTAGNVNFNYCNPTAAGVTPTAMTVNWSVRRP